MVLAEVCWEADRDNIVSAVPRGGQVSPPLTCLVHWTRVTQLLWDLTACHGLEPDLLTHHMFPLHHFNYNYFHHFFDIIAVKCMKNSFIIC